MSSRASRSTLLLLATALAAMALVAAGLPRLRLSPGLPLPSVNGEGVLLEMPGQPLAERVPMSRAMLWVLASGAGLLVLYALWRALRGVRLSAILPVVLRGIGVLGIMCAAVLVLAFLTPPGFIPAPIPELPPPPPAARTPLGEPPAVLLWLTAGGLLAASGLVAAWLLRPRPPPRDPLILVGLEAERARAELLAGGDARSAILACYARMSAVLAEERDIQRPGSMTAREFAGLLGSLGVPGPPVLELTRLFESVRYGAGRPGAAEVKRALACLGSIVEHCHAARREP